MISSPNMSGTPKHLKQGCARCAEPQNRFGSTHSHLASQHRLVLLIYPQNASKCIAVQPPWYLHFSFKWNGCGCGGGQKSVLHTMQSSSVLSLPMHLYCPHQVGSWVMHGNYTILVKYIPVLSFPKWKCAPPKTKTFGSLKPCRSESMCQKMATHLECTPFPLKEDEHNSFLIGPWRQ